METAIDEYQQLEFDALAVQVLRLLISMSLEVHPPATNC